MLLSSLPNYLVAAVVSHLKGKSAIDVPRMYRAGSAVLWLFACVLTAEIAVASGPLRRHPTNPIYFTDNTGKAIYLAGAHTWASLQDMGQTDPPPPFDYRAHLDWLQAHGHNFFKLWAWEQARYSNDIESDDYWITPSIYERTGPGLALDGKPKFNLDRFNEEYFRRLRDRAAEAERRGIYVSVMLFNGWSIEPSKGPKRSNRLNNPWKAHPFNRSNNINGVSGEEGIRWLLSYFWPARSSGRYTHVNIGNSINKYQKRYVEKVIDSINDLDNVLYEISNESPAESKTWQYDMIDHIRAYEAKKPKQHPIGMTVSFPGGVDADLWRSPADWISPNKKAVDYLNDPPVAKRAKLIISDTDHLCGICGDPQWPWKSFMRGIHVAFMDVYDGSYPGESEHNPYDPEFVSIRRQLGYVLGYARRVNLASITPQPDLCSTRYCLATMHAPVDEILVYRPARVRDRYFHRAAGVMPGWILKLLQSFSVNLSGLSGSVALEWFEPESGRTIDGERIRGGGSVRLKPPFKGDAVAYLRKVNGSQ
jgi:hypothetical protein